MEISFLSSPSPVAAFGGYFVGWDDPIVDPPPNAGELIVIFLDGGIHYPIAPTPGFIGFISGPFELPFTSIVAFSSLHIWLDDMYVGTAAQPSNGVPEPATILLLGSGLVGLVGLWRKVKK